MNLCSVLLAEDNPELRRTIKAGLEAVGYRVRAACNGAEAVRFQEDEAADILITDVFMPDMDGIEAIEVFRHRFPQTRIVAISGEGQRVKREYLSVAALVGVDATLKKPFGMPALLAALDDLEPPSGPV